MRNDMRSENDIVDAELANSQFAQAISSQPKLVERLLSPQNLSRMMASGGGLLVTGFAVWLWSIGVFENPVVVATAVGVTNLALLGIGILLFQLTRYKIAGRGITLLSSLVLPLNLWLYDSQGILSLDTGGQLWIPALVCCVIYALVARITRDSMFVYTFVGGVVLTGMLFLAGSPATLSWSVLPIATFLVALGSICVHADCWFLETDSPFSRDKFGLAFFRAGQAVVIAGLAVLLGGQLMHTAGTFLSNFTTDSHFAGMVNQFHGKLWSVGVLIAAASTFVYSTMTKRGHRGQMLMAGTVGVWAVISTIDLYNIQITIDMFLLVLGTSLFLWNLFCSFARTSEHFRCHSTLVSVVSLVLLTIGAIRFCAQLWLRELLFIDAMHAAQLLTASMAILTLPAIWQKSANRVVSDALVFVGSTGLMLATICAMSISDFGSTSITLCVVSAIPLFISTIGLISTNHTLSQRAGWVSSALVATLYVVWLTLSIISPLMLFFGTTTSIALMVTLCATSVITSYSNSSRIAIVGTLVSAATAIIQLFVIFNLTSPYVIIICISVIGLVVLAFSKIAIRFRLHESDSPVLSRLQQAANSLICVGVGGAVLFVSFALVNVSTELNHLSLLAFHLAAVGVAALATSDAGWRRAFLVAATAIVGTGVLAFSTLSDLSVLRRIELGSLALGTLMVAAGYVGWIREKNRQDDIVSFNLVVGSCLLVVPMILGVLLDRLVLTQTIDGWRCLHEVGGLTVGLLLLGTGILCQIRSTTLSGGVLLSVFVLGNILLIHLPEELQNTSVLMMIGGGAFFGVAVLLSIYRERIIALPEKVRAGKGVFQVLKWR